MSYINQTRLHRQLGDIFITVKLYFGSRISFENVYTLTEQLTPICPASSLVLAKRHPRPELGYHTIASHPTQTPGGFRIE